MLTVQWSSLAFQQVGHIYGIMLILLVMKLTGTGVRLIQLHVLLKYEEKKMRRNGFSVIAGVL